LKEKIMEDKDRTRKGVEQGRNVADKSPDRKNPADSVNAASTGSGEGVGVGIPQAGDHEMGVGGASGESDQGTGSARSGKTGNARANFGVAGKDLNRDGLPPK
jgi:hypothetical protein